MTTEGERSHEIAQRLRKSFLKDTELARQHSIKWHTQKYKQTGWV